MSAPLAIANNLIVTPAARGPTAAYIPLWLYQGTSFSGSWAWIDNNAGVNPASAVASVIFRQLPGDVPIAAFGTTSTAQGSVVYQAAVPNFPWLPPQLAATGDAPTLITLYPFEVVLTQAGLSAVAAVNYCQWSFNLTWPDGSVTPLIEAPVYVQGV
jgi:hypothetical protein